MLLVEIKLTGKIHFNDIDYLCALCIQFDSLRRGRTSWQSVRGRWWGGTWAPSSAMTGRRWARSRWCSRRWSRRTCSAPHTRNWQTGLAPEETFHLSSSETTQHLKEDKGMLGRTGGVKSRWIQLNASFQVYLELLFGLPALGFDLSHQLLVPHCAANALSLTGISHHIVDLWKYIS